MHIRLQGAATLQECCVGNPFINITCQQLQCHMHGCVGPHSDVTSAERDPHADCRCHSCCRRPPTFAATGIWGFPGSRLFLAMRALKKCVHAIQYCSGQRLGLTCTLSWRGDLGRGRGPGRRAAGKLTQTAACRRGCYATSTWELAIGSC